MAPALWISALYGGELSASRPGRFTPGEGALGNHWIGGWVDPRAGLDALEKRKISYPCRELYPSRRAGSLSLYRLSCRGLLEKAALRSLGSTAVRGCRVYRHQ
jgi:hypothetical protein